jgi:hypothetical protein
MEILDEEDGLDTWFDSSKGGGTWVDISRTNDDGSHPECGENTKKKGYPKCVPKKKADQMTKKEKERLVRRKRRKNNDSKQDPDMVSSDPSDQRKSESVIRSFIRNQVREDVDTFKSVSRMLNEDEDLDNWFDEENWVDISRTVDGEHPPCGESSDDEDRKDDPEHEYPKCVPKSKAEKLSDEEKEELVRKKRQSVESDDEDQSSEDGDSDEPTYTSSDPDEDEKNESLRTFIRKEIHKALKN